MMKSRVSQSISLCCILAAPLLVYAQTGPAGPSTPSGATSADSGKPPPPHRDAGKTTVPDTSKASNAGKNSASDKNKSKNKSNPQPPDGKTAP